MSTRPSLPVVAPTASRLAAQAIALQAASLASTERSNAAIAVTTGIATGAQTTLQRDKERLAAVEEASDQVGAAATQANTKANKFLRKVATNKLVTILLLLIVVAAIGCVIALAINKRKPQP